VAFFSFIFSSFIFFFTGSPSVTGRSFVGEGALCAVTSALWIVAAALSLWVLRHMHNKYKERGTAGAHEAKRQVISAAAKEAGGLVAQGVFSGAPGNKV
jgi:hypothetical protein